MLPCLYVLPILLYRYYYVYVQLSLFYSANIEKIQSYEY